MPPPSSTLLRVNAMRRRELLANAFSGGKKKDPGMLVNFVNGPVVAAGSDVAKICEVRAGFKPVLS